MNAPLSRYKKPTTLAEQLNSLIDADGVFETTIPGLILMRCSGPTERGPVIYEPSLYVVAQGRKRAYLAEEIYRYDADNYLVLPVPMPLEAQVTEASPEHPYLALRLNIDLGLLGELLLQMDEPSDAGSPANLRGLYVCPTDRELETTLLRILGCLEDREKREILAPLLIKEALFHLLRGPQGWQLRAFAQQNRNHNRIAQLLQHIQRHYSDTLEVGDLAAFANMSASNLHHQFKAVTGLSPIQYLKTVRLHQARRLLLHDHQTIGDAAFQVGYASPSQFSREYKRLFGIAPSRDPLTSAQTGSGSRSD